VYVLLVGLIVPQKMFCGIVSFQALVMLGLYLLGFLMALIVGFVLQFIIKTKERSFFIMELPIYRMPRWNNVLITMWEKAKIFTLEAGKIILAVSVILWALASFGPSKKMEKIKTEYEIKLNTINADKNILEAEYAAIKLENSYAGHIGKAIEPMIRPLGYDWKIGIALITSFAAREVFVGTVSTLYSVGSNQSQNETLHQKMKNQRHSDTHTPVFTFASVISLLLFYAFAMQCMSTIAVVKRETGSWKIAMLQIGFLTTLAYLSAFVAYQLLS
jgi:ferrous iron transport protein B